MRTEVNDKIWNEISFLDQEYYIKEDNLLRSYLDEPHIVSIEMTKLKEWYRLNLDKIIRRHQYVNGRTKPNPLRTIPS